MTPQTQIVEKEQLEEARIQEQFIRQVEDHSLPAQQVLTDQQELRLVDETPRLFVP